MKKELRTILNQFIQSSASYLSIDLKQDQVFLELKKTHKSGTSPSVKKSSGSEVETSKSTSSKKQENQELLSEYIGHIRWNSSFLSTWEKDPETIISPSTVIATIEVLGLVNEITLPEEGVVLQLLGEQDDIVQYGQPILQWRKKRVS